MDLTDRVRAYWDADAATYDDSPDHGAASPAERAAWNAALARLLPAPPCRTSCSRASTPTGSAKPSTSATRSTCSSWRSRGVGRCAFRMAGSGAWAGVRDRIERASR